MLEKLAPAFLAGLPTHREAGQPDGVPHRARRPPDHRVRHPARGHAPAAVRQRRPACSTSSPSRTRSRSPAPRTPPGCCAPTPTCCTAASRLGVEADSLNCSILGPDVTVDDPEFDLFVKGVVTEMTVKAGQKCTAIRRVIVPADDRRRRHRGDRRRGWRRSPSATPPAEDVRMGAAGQPRPARGGAQGDPVAARLRRDRVRRPGPRRRRRRRRRARRVPRRPVLLRADRGCGRAARRRAVRPGQHGDRPTTRVDEAVELAARGKGSLVGVAGHPRPRRRPDRRARRWRRGTAGSWSSTATTPASPPATAPRCRCWSTAAPAAPAAARSSAASAACCTTCSAPRSRPRPTC